MNFIRIFHSLCLFVSLLLFRLFRSVVQAPFAFNSISSIRMFCSPFFFVDVVVVLVRFVGISPVGIGKAK